MVNFIREKFEILLVAGLFTLVFMFYVTNVVPERSDALRELWQGLLYAFLALLGVRPRATAIGTASTESGDIITQPPPADPAKEKPKDVKP
jgi:hypothetical protein